MRVLTIDEMMAVSGGGRLDSADHDGSRGSSGSSGGKSGRGGGSSGGSGRGSSSSDKVCRPGDKSYSSDSLYTSRDKDGRVEMHLGSQTTISSSKDTRTLSEKLGEKAGPHFGGGHDHHN